MVQTLREIIELENYDEASLLEALSSFKATDPNSKESQDVMHFLKEEAISMEKLGTTRTYLIVNDNKWDKGILQIDGYFSLALKNLYFDTKLDKRVIAEISGDENKKNLPAYLIGQLARAETTKKGDGKVYLKTALEYIVNASDIVGGRIVYLDCTHDRQAYYEKQGFSFLQEKKRSDLVQMYRII